MFIDISVSIVIKRPKQISVTRPPLLPVRMSHTWEDFVRKSCSYQIQATKDYLSAIDGFDSIEKYNNSQICPFHLQICPSHCLCKICFLFRNYF